MLTFLYLFFQIEKTEHWDLKAQWNQVAGTLTARWIPFLCPENQNARTENRQNNLKNLQFFKETWKKPKILQISSLFNLVINTKNYLLEKSYL